MVLPNTLYCVELEVNLISVSQLLKKKWSVLFEEESIRIKIGTAL